MQAATAAAQMARRASAEVVGARAALVDLFERKSIAAALSTTKAFSCVFLVRNKQLFNDSYIWNKHKSTDSKKTFYHNMKPVPEEGSYRNSG
ncbi:hypothetical protein GCM10027321_36260 [Massilia terrae]|uniref:Uncharacterized protein n=1 Tax=Massilia terrae TaxID=1811224 RepID=A0ABT2D3G3_9BURK|nr:hypothetical protein [Massilia terrae]MCS0660791.1 hypothetical protein [Massilia terrae]